MKSLVIGMGIGQLYKAVLEDLGHKVYTVDTDPSKGADFTNYIDAYRDHLNFDTVHICTPNFTHVHLARFAGAHDTKIVFIEKPGVANHYEWLEMLRDYPNTRFMMVKNNQYRQEIEHFQDLAARSNSVTICWNNYNRIPSPGSWFTDRSKSFGGVSRDLIPHMLSYYCKLVDYNKGNKLYANAVQRWTLDKIDSTDYGLVNSNGIYDVDDFCEMEFVNGKTKFILTANWRNLKENNISICFDLESSAVRYELGLCPESAYKKMIAQAITNLDNESYWLEQKNQDIWIHKQIERL